MEQNKPIETIDVAQTNDTWEVLEGPGIWLPKVEGESIMGFVIATQEGAYGPQYIIEIDQNKRILTPSHKVLQNRMVNVEVGQMVKITYMGTEPATTKGYNPVQLYEVKRKRI